MRLELPLDPRTNKPSPVRARKLPVSRERSKTLFAEATTFMDTPMPVRGRSWSMEKSGIYSYKGTEDETTSENFYDAVEEARLSDSMNQAKVAITAPSHVQVEKEYQSSEEALSPEFRDYASAAAEKEDESVKDNELPAEEDAEDYLAEWTVTAAKAFEVDIAVAVNVQTIGKAQVVNVPERWSAYRGRQSHRFSSRPPSQSPSVPLRSRASTPSEASYSRSRTPSASTYLSTIAVRPQLDTSFAQSHSSLSSRPGTPEYARHSRTPTVTSLHRNTSSSTTATLISQPESASTLSRNTSSSTTATYVSGPESVSTLSRTVSSSTSSTYVSQLESVTPRHSFLEQDPFQLPHAVQRRPTTRQKFRTVSSKLMASLNSPGADSPIPVDSDPMALQRRRSVIAASAPETISQKTPFFFSQSAKDEWMRSQHQEEKIVRSHMPDEKIPVPYVPRSMMPPMGLTTSATSDKRFPRMVARGANERTSTFDLPPCPTGYEGSAGIGIAGLAPRASGIASGLSKKDSKKSKPKMSWSRN